MYTKTSFSGARQNSFVETSKYLFMRKQSVVLYREAVFNIQVSVVRLLMNIF